MKGEAYWNRFSRCMSFFSSFRLKMIVSSILLKNAGLTDSFVQNAATRMRTSLPTTVVFSVRLADIKHQLPQGLCSTGCAIRF